MAIACRDQPPGRARPEKTLGREPPAGVRDAGWVHHGDGGSSQWSGGRGPGTPAHPRAREGQGGGGGSGNQGVNALRSPGTKGGPSRRAWTSDRQRGKRCSAPGRGPARGSAARGFPEQPLLVLQEPEREHPDCLVVGQPTASRTRSRKLSAQGIRWPSRKSAWARAASAASASRPSSRALCSSEHRKERNSSSYTM